MFFDGIKKFGAGVFGKSKTGREMLQQLLEEGPGAYPEVAALRAATTLVRPPITARHTDASVAPVAVQAASSDVTAAGRADRWCSALNAPSPEQAQAQAQAQARPYPRQHRHEGQF